MRASLILVPSRLTAVALVLGLAACAGGEDSSLPQLQSANTGSVAASALTAGTDSAAARTCDEMLEALNVRVQLLSNKRALAEREAAAPPDNLVRAFQRMTGPPGAGIASLEDYNRELARATSLNQAMTAKGCKPVNIEAQIAQTKPQTPTATADAAKPLFENGRRGGVFGK